MPKRPWKDLILVNKKKKRGVIMKRIDIVGQKFGYLLCLEMLYNYNSRHETFCKCVCDCGNVVYKNANGLRRKSAYPKHCGCMTSTYKKDQNAKSRIDLTGQRYGRLVVREMIFEQSKQTMVVCDCDCGKTIISYASYIKSGDTMSCGCLKKERASESNTKDFTDYVSNYGVKMLRRDHKNQNGVWMWVCECGICGKEFVALPAKVQSCHTTSCGCVRRSHGEQFVGKFLSDSNVNYVAEYRFDDCKNVISLPFDFYLPDYNAVIEYQGGQHYKSVEYFGGIDGYLKRRRNDSIKRKYCIEHGIAMVEVPYWMSPEDIKQKITSIIYP